MIKFIHHRILLFKLPLRDADKDARPVFSLYRHPGYGTVSRHCAFKAFGICEVITGKESIRSAGMVIAYMTIGNRMTRSEVDDVRQIIRNARNDENAPLPSVIP